MKTISIAVNQIEPGSAKDIRKSGNIPAVIYGRSFDNLFVSIDYQTFKKAFKQGGESTIYSLEIAEKKIPVIVHDIQYNPLTDKFRHIDFHAVRMDEKIHANIPIHLEGEAPAVKLLSGILMHSKETLEVKCLPKDLIPEIKINISSLVNFHDTITVEDLSIPEAITVLDDPSDIIATVSAPRVEEESTTVTETNATPEENKNTDKKE